MACCHKTAALVQVYRTEHFLMCLDLFDRLGLHQIIDEKAAIGRASHQMSIPDVKQHVHCKLIHMMAWIFLYLYSSAGLYETA